MEKTVLIYLIKDNCYLMLYRNKKKNDLNEGKYIGIGGHIEKGETKEQALIREVKEETGLLLNSFIYRGGITFINDKYKEIMYLYTSDDFVGELKECKEGSLSWIPIENVIDLPLWEGDKAFLDLLNNNESDFALTLIYHQDTLIKYIRTK